MCDIVVNFLMSKIVEKNHYSKEKQEQIKYGLLCVYSLITKTTILVIISIFLKITKEFFIFLFFYNFLRSFGFGAHAKSELACWTFSILLLLGFPYMFKIITIKFNTKIIIWIICFINLLIFSPADTEKKPMISKKRILKLKIVTLLISVIYLFLICKFNAISNYVVAALILEAYLVNPISYILFGQKIRFRLNYIDLSKNRMEVKDV